jgi:hypothetical protein
LYSSWKFKSWNLIFKFSRPWKLLEKDLSPGNSWNFYKVLLEFSRLSNVHTFAVKFMQSRMNDIFHAFCLLVTLSVNLTNIASHGTPDLQIFLEAQLRCCVICNLLIYCGTRFRDRPTIITILSLKICSKIRLQPSEIAKIFSGVQPPNPQREGNTPPTPTRSTAKGRVRRQSRRLSHLRHFENWKVLVSQSIHNSVVDAF